MPRIVVHNYLPVRDSNPRRVPSRRFRATDCGGDCDCNHCRVNRDSIPLKFRDAAQEYTKTDLQTLALEELQRIYNRYAAVKRDFKRESFTKPQAVEATAMVLREAGKLNWKAPKFDRVGRDAPTLTKAAAGYVAPAPGPDYCKDCSMFRARSYECSLVQGSIRRDGVCREFDPA